MSTSALRAALYLRVSTARQAEHDLSIPDQRKQGEAYRAARGYQLVETYVEPGASATNDRRPEFQRMMEAGTTRPPAFDVVIVHSFSRFFRGATRDQARLDAERAAAALEANGQAITVDHLRRFAEAARRRMRTPQGYRRDYLRALAQRVEVSEGEVRIMGSKTTLLRALAAIGGVETATGGVRISVPNWRAMLDEDEHYS